MTPNPYTTDRGTGFGRFLKPDAGKKRDLAGLAVAAAVLVLAVGIGWDASGYTVRRSYAQFGPDIFPYVVAIGLALAGLATILMALRGNFPERDRVDLVAMAWVAGALVVMIICLYARLGFIISSATLFGMAARGMGQKPLWLNLFVGLGVSVVLYFLFQYALSLSLPRGVIENAINGLMRG